MNYPGALFQVDKAIIATITTVDNTLNCIYFTRSLHDGGCMVLEERGKGKRSKGSQPVVAPTLVLGDVHLKPGTILGFA